jgi:hypothetical protein
MLGCVDGDIGELIAVALINALACGGLGLTLLCGLLAARQRCVGTVVDQEDDWSGMKPVVAFTTSSGEQVRFTSHLSGGWELGAEAPVRYSIRKPQRAWIDKFTATWSWVIMWLLLGPGALLVLLLFV